MLLLPSFRQQATKTNVIEKTANNQTFSSIKLNKYAPHSINTLKKKINTRFLEIEQLFPFSSTGSQAK